MRRIETFLLAAGLVGLAAIVAQVGAAAVLECLARLSWTLPLLFVLVGVPSQLCEALAWRFAFPRDLVRLRTLFAVRLAGEALNMTTPTASVGGEGVKAWLLRDRGRAHAVVPSLIVAKTSETTAQGIVLVLGLAVASGLPQLDPRLLHGMVALLGVEVLAIGGFVAVQVVGAVARGGALLARLGLVRGRAARGATLRIDRALARYYRRRRSRFAVSVAANVVACLLQVLETLVVAHVLGAPLTLGEAVVVNAAASAIAFAGFFVPGQIAVREGAFVAAFVALGQDPAIGLSVGLAKRLLDLSWAGLGFLELARRRRAGAPTTVRSPA